MINYDLNKIKALVFDVDGVFFDVTEALELQPQSDFADPVHYTAIGFTEDNCFAYYSTTDNVYERTYYIVPLDNLAPEAIQEGNPLSENKGAGHILALGDPLLLPAALEALNQ